MINMISWLVKRSQRPSEAMTRILSFAVRFGKTKISGLAVTPTLVAAMSPIDLVIASPGTYLFLSQTRFGP